MSSGLKEIGRAGKPTARRERTYADLIVAYLNQVGVEYVFGVPGGAIAPLFSALAHQSPCDPSDVATGLSPRILSRRTPRRTRELRAVVARHEAGAAFMADGYARETGKLGVCCATTGPGAASLVTGIASAYADQIPMLVITAREASPYPGSGALQDTSGDAIDTVGMLQQCTRYNDLVYHPEQLERKLLQAMVAAYRKPGGPAHISVPVDILRRVIAAETAPCDVATLFRQPDVVDTQSFDALCQVLFKAHRIVLFLGDGCRGSIDAIVQFAELMEAVIVTTPSGKGFIDAHHHLYRGVLGFAGHASALESLADEDVDLVLVAGTGMDELSACGCDVATLSGGKLVHIDANMENFVHSPAARLHVYGNLRTVFMDLVQVFTSVDYQDQTLFSGGPYARGREASRQAVSSWRLPNSSISFGTPRKVSLHQAEKYLCNDTPIKPQRLMCELSRRFPHPARFVCGAGNCRAWAIHYLHLRKGGCFRTGAGYGAVTWAIGAAVGTALGDRGLPVVCLTGDGSFLVSGQELTVAVQHRLAVIFVILNDQVPGVVRHGRAPQDGDPACFELPPVDYAAVARAMGAQAHTIRSPEDFDALDIEAMCTAAGPTLLDVYIDPDEVPPTQTGMNLLQTDPAG
ncbi:MAG TPA: thiamine pyrophosphate-binding protein [Gammaproteobacteria bacterium]|nr:thiamine pyrophosphate-binding protein [Gammaproteobacteria bacterium]